MGGQLVGTAVRGRTVVAAVAVGGRSMGMMAGGGGWLIDGRWLSVVIGVFLYFH